MKPLQHARNSSRIRGGSVDLWLPVHNFFDSTKAAMPDMRHRAILHSAFGIFLVERVFGTYITTEDGVQVSVRDIGEQHVLEDLGTIPTLERWLKNMPFEAWMGGELRGKRSRFVSMQQMTGEGDDHEQTKDEQRPEQCGGCSVRRDACGQEVVQGPAEGAGEEGCGNDVRVVLPGAS